MKCELIGRKPIKRQRGDFTMILAKSSRHLQYPLPIANYAPRIFIERCFDTHKTSRLATPYDKTALDYDAYVSIRLISEEQVNGYA